MPNRILRDYTDSYRVANITADAERLYVRLIQKADDYGRFHAEPLMLRAQCFPLLTTIRGTDIPHWLAECEKAGLIVVYEVKQRKYLAIVEFKQSLRAEASKYPPPEGQPPDWRPSFDEQMQRRCSADALQVHSGCDASAPVGVVGDGDGGANGRLPRFTDGMVDELYQAYPRKKAPGHAKQAIRRALVRIANRPNPPEDAFAWLLEQVRAFAKSGAGNQGQFTKHPATWFNGECYDEQPTEWGGMPSAENADAQLHALFGRKLAGEHIPLNPNDEKKFEEWKKNLGGGK